MNEFKVKEHTFRIKKMNAIELLALRSGMNFDEIDKLQKTYDNMLERIELKVNDNNWIQVKQGNDFYPAGIEDDFEAIEQLIQYFLTYMKEVFTKSSELK